MDKPKTMNELMRYYDHRIEELELKLAIAEEENSKLKSRSLSTATGSTVLNAGAEAELYPDEIHEVLVDVIKDARRNILDGSRRADIIDDILKHNPVQKIPDQKAKALKAALKGYRVMDKTTKRKLEALGIELEPQKRTHYRLRYYGDPRYYATMAASGSDVRGGNNLAAELINKFF